MRSALPILPSSVLVAALACALTTSACEPRCPRCPASPGIAAFAPTFGAARPPAPIPITPGAVPEASQRDKVAVLPLADDRLFRAERVELRLQLAGELTRLATEYAVLPLAEVDAKLQPVSAATGARCAFEGVPADRRARTQGWLTTEVMHVGGLAPAPDELWVRIGGAEVEGVTFTAPWAPRLDAAGRYRTAFSNLSRKQGGAALLGGLAATGSGVGALRAGPLTICETRHFGACDAGTSDWKDATAVLAGCFAGEDEAVTELVVLGDGASARCEIADLDRPEGGAARREACVCRALGASAALRARPGRRGVRVAFEAADLAGKPRPEMRVVETSMNLASEVASSWEQRTLAGKTEQKSLRRLVVDHLDALAAPLARCDAAPGSAVVADLDVREDGRVIDVRLVTPLAKPADGCVQKALAAGSFTCTDDGKTARLRVTLAWPPKAR